MTGDHLSNIVGLPNTWSQAISKALTHPDLYLQRLYDLAVKEQNQNMDMDWDSVDLSKIPLPLRQAIANMFGQFHYGETVGLLSVSRLIEASHNPSLKKCFELQAVDESRHVKWLSMLMQKLECECELHPVTTHLLTQVYESDSLEKLALGIHVFIETLAHSYCMEGQKVFSGRAGVKAVSRTYRAARTVMGRWLPDFIGRDESRHIAFGHYFLSQVIPQLSFKQRDSLEQFASHLGQIMADAVDDPDLVFAPGLDGPSAGARSFIKINHQLAKLGLSARIPDAYGVNSVR